MTTIVRGIPTAPDVEKLVGAFPSLKEGDVVTYSDIENIIEKEKGTNRFNSVTFAWRKRLFRESNLVLDSIPNEGYKVLPPSERVGFSGRKFVGGLRTMGRAAAVAGMTERNKLSSEQIKTLDHIVRTTASLKLTAKLEAQKLRIEAP